MERTHRRSLGRQRLALWVVLGSLAALALVVNFLGLLQLIRLAPDGTTGDWYWFGQVDPARPYAFAEFFRWAPISAWGWHLLVIPLGWHLWVVLHVASLGLLRDWRASGLALLSWPFWEDALNGNVITFVMVLAWCALRGERWAVIAYVALFAVMPRPLMLPVLAWLLWHRTDARWALGTGIIAVLASSLALGQLDEWVLRLLLSSSELVSPYNIGPTAFLGMWWVPIGLALGAWLTWKGRLGLASLAVSPYWLPYYLLMGLLELRGRDQSSAVAGLRGGPDAGCYSGSLTGGYEYAAMFAPLSAEYPDWGGIWRCLASRAALLLKETPPSCIVIASHHFIRQADYGTGTRALTATLGRQ